VIIKSRHDKLGEKYAKRAGRGVLSSRPVIWIRRGNYWDLLFFEIGKNSTPFARWMLKGLKGMKFWQYRFIAL
jgi:hypothetical protein